MVPDAQAAELTALPSRRPRRAGASATREQVAAYAFLTPWLIGFLAFTLGPMLVSAVLSLTDYQVLNPGATRFVGTSNFTAALHDPVLAHSLRVTLFFATLAVPADLAVGLVLALVVNARARGMGALRTVLFLPIMIGGAAGGSVAVALLWLWMFQPRFGLLNRLLALVHLPPQLWVASPRLVVPSLALMSLWGVGRSMLIYLAALQRVPTDLVWAAQMDGAGAWRRFVSVVLPLISPAILFNLVLDLIYAMQAFTPAYVVTNGGPGDSSLFFMLYLYRNAFTYLHMGYASALAWLLFALTLALTVMIFRTARSWVFYEGAPNR